MIRRLFTPLLLGLALTACGYSPFAVRGKAIRADQPGVSVEARLLDDGEWDSGGRDDLLAVQVTVANTGSQPFDVEPWDFVLSSTRIETRPVPPLKAAVASAWHHPLHSVDGWGLLRLTLYLLYLPVEKLALVMESGPNTERLDDFTRHAMQPASIQPGTSVTGILFFEESRSNRVELGWTIWSSDGSPLHGPELLLEEKNR